MVDAIGGRTTNGAAPVTRVATPPAARPVETVTRDTMKPSAALGRVAREMAASPPVDTDRVARIKRAVAEGRFPISPSTIADQMIALRLDWVKGS